MVIRLPEVPVQAIVPIVRVFPAWKMIEQFGFSVNVPAIVKVELMETVPFEAAPLMVRLLRERPLALIVFVEDDVSEMTTVPPVLVSVRLLDVGANIEPVPLRVSVPDSLKLLLAAVPVNRAEGAVAAKPFISQMPVMILRNPEEPIVIALDCWNVLLGAVFRDIPKGIDNPPELNVVVPRP